MTTEELYNAHKKTKIVPVTKKVYRSVLDFFTESHKNGNLYKIAETEADKWIANEESNQKEAYLDGLKKDKGFFSGIFHTAPKPYSKDFRDGFAFGYINACKKETFLADNISKDKLDKLMEFLIDNGISITAVNNELLIQNSKEIGEIREYKLVEENI